MCLQLGVGMPWAVVWLTGRLLLGSLGDECDRHEFALLVT
jgi:hypothetical protein